MNPADYKFLEHFLDATKANLFFAKGLIMVEGDAENLLIPAIAELMDRHLHKHGVSIVNVNAVADGNQGGQNLEHGNNIKPSVLLLLTRSTNNSFMCYPTRMPAISTGLNGKNNNEKKLVKTLQKTTTNQPKSCISHTSCLSL